MTKIEILGTGCAKCKRLFANVRGGRKGSEDHGRRNQG